LGQAQNEIFLKMGLDRKLLICPSGKSARRAHRPTGRANARRPNAGAVDYGSLIRPWF
jgi:hypothetical protein